ncbi:MAG TPA: hypothetical protein GYA06_11265 [Chloroflexi bacterium]|nr:hypothetical protein [Chloroflexota bacterium]HPO59003.1 hypothetical protein [Anaerolineaceae bacterium]
MIAFLLCLLPFYAAQRWLHRELQAVFLTLTRRPDAALGLFALFLFPGVLLHEVSHWAAARLLGVPTGRISLIPRALPGGRLRLGYVQTAQTNLVKDALIGLAPFLTGAPLTGWIAGSRLGLAPLWDLALQGDWAAVRAALPLVTQQPDFWVWFYLAVCISSTMLPSPSDRRAWLPLAGATLAAGAAAAAAGAGTWMSLHLAPALDTFLSNLAAVLAGSLLVHLALALPVTALRVALGRVFRLRVVSVSR